MTVHASDAEPAPHATPIDLSFLDDEPSEPWDAAVALRLMHAADDLVERLGVPGLHPAVQTAAAAVVAAHRDRDMSAARRAVARFEGVVRRLNHTNHTD